MLRDLMPWLAAVGAGGAAAGALQRWVVLPLIRGARRLSDFLDDWGGVPDRPGVPGRPGVMRRLERIEWHVGNGSARPLRDVVETLEAEVARLRGGK